MDRILRDFGGSVTMTTYDEAGAVADADGSNAPTVVVTDSAGVAVPGFTGARDSAGVYHANLPANLETLDEYAVGWSWPNGRSASSSFELVGAFLFATAELRARDSRLLDTVAFPQVKLRAIRAAIEDVFESRAVTARAFRPRGRRLTKDGSGRDVLVLPDFDVTVLRAVSIRSGSTADVWTSPEIAGVTVDPEGYLIRNSGSAWPEGRRNVTVLYEYGQREVPAMIREVALMAAVDLLLPSPMESGRATAVFTELGGYRITIAGRDGPFGIPDVDAELARWSRVWAGAVG